MHRRNILPGKKSMGEINAKEKQEYCRYKYMSGKINAWEKQVIICRNNVIICRNNVIICRNNLNGEINIL